MPLTLDHLLTCMFEVQALEGDNMYACNTCGTLQDGYTQLAVIEYPPVLVLTLMRFTYDKLTSTRLKINDSVLCPATLQMPTAAAAVPGTELGVPLCILNPLCYSILSQTYGNNPVQTVVSHPPSLFHAVLPPIYDLCAMVVHSGSRYIQPNPSLISTI